MRKTQVHNRPYLKETRRTLRQELTPAEKLLWKVLKGKNIEGRKFRRQHSIEDFIVDFYCAKEKLVIELDGEVHNNINAQYNDEERDKRLKELDYTIMRFENKEVINNLDNVLREIENYFLERENN
jgi:very-short-patch-repair endonuclease